MNFVWKARELKAWTNHLLQLCSRLAYQCVMFNYLKHICIYCDLCHDFLSTACVMFQSGCD